MVGMKGETLYDRIDKTEDSARQFELWVNGCHGERDTITTTYAGHEECLIVIYLT